MAAVRKWAMALGAGGCLFLSACASGGQWSPDSDWTSDEKTKLNGVGNPTELTDAKGFSLPDDWVGVRHDLIISPSLPRKERCSCLAVEVGAPDDPKFRWQGDVAPSFALNKLAVAISARGVGCEGGNPDESQRRASISAVDRRGGDVIVEVEELPVGRPLATGAIIDVPSREGAIYVRAKNKRVVYARPEEGTLRSLCRVY